MAEGIQGSGPRHDTIAAYLLARSVDDHPALVFEGETWTWSELVSESEVRARLLADLGAEPFHVGVLLENVPEYVFLLFGAALAGATVVGVNSTRRGAELERDIRHTDCQAVFTDSALAPMLAGLDLGPVEPVVVDTGSYAARVEAHRAGPSVSGRPDPQTLYLLVFTAGSTGAPKAVRMSQGRATRTAADTARAFRADDVLYCSMPLFHGNALVANLFPALIAGATVVLRRRFSASAFLDDVRRQGCTYFNYVGRALSYILSMPETPVERDTALKWALGSEASPQNIAEFTRRYGVPVFEGYGSSENAVVIAPAPGAPPGSLGRPKSGIDVAVVNPETGEECPPARLDAEGRLANPDEAIGEIVGRDSAERFEGYYNNPEAEAERLRNGWYWTGDLGYRDADGFFYFAGRTADWIRVDGENFSAGAVERILNRLPGTTGVAVYGVPDPRTGDQVMAAVEVEDPDAFDSAEFTRFLGSQPDLGTKWTPRFIRLLGVLPVTGTGKVDKAPLRSQSWETADPVWWRPGRQLAFRLLTEDDRRHLRAQFEESGRGALLPSG